MTDEGDTADALAMLEGAEQTMVYLAALRATAENYPPEMTEGDRENCNRALGHLSGAAYEQSDWMSEAMGRCTSAERGWCMWLNYLACEMVRRHKIGNPEAD